MNILTYMGKLYSKKKGKIIMMFPLI